MKKVFIILIIIAFLAAIVYVAFLRTPAENNSIKNNMNHIITIKTNMGEIRFMTYDKDAPKAVNNFITLAQEGFYDGVIFHRVIDGFMIQGGDPTGTGSGGPGYTFEDELNPETESYKEGYKKGVVAMANAGPDTNGSQFFIMVADYPLPHRLHHFWQSDFGAGCSRRYCQSGKGLKRQADFSNHNGKGDGGGISIESVK